MSWHLDFTATTPKAAKARINDAITRNMLPASVAEALNSYIDQFKEVPGFGGLRLLTHGHLAGDNNISTSSVHIELRQIELVEPTNG